MNKLLEKDIQRTIIEYLGYKKVFHYRNNSRAIKLPRRGGEGLYFFGTPGSPDVVAVIKGQYVGIEVKTDKGHQSPIQEQFQERLEKAGGRYILARSVDDIIKAGI